MNDAVWSQLATGRLQLADSLEQLPPEAWDVQSLCDDWRVRDVVAHIILESGYTVGMVVVGVIRAKGDINRFMSYAATSLGKLPPAELIARLRASAPSHKLPIGIKPNEALCDLYMHTLDIKVPLSIASPLTADQLKQLLELMTSPSLMAKVVVPLQRKIAGLEFRATDFDWSFGRGHLVSGPVLSLVLAISGRTAGLGALTGDGVPILTTRLQASDN